MAPSRDRDRLRDYRAKRDFAATGEPRGDADAAAPAAVSPRFVIQQHDASRLHWDLRLERDGTLASWALPRGIPMAPHDERIAVRTEEHPLAYLDFHGEIPAGSYGAGTMEIWDHGTYATDVWSERKVEVTLAGERVSGRYGLHPIGRRGGEDTWMIHRLDPPSDAGWEPLPRHLAPMLAQPGALPPKAEDARWAYEVKWDGVRALLWSDHGHVRIESRTQREIGGRYPEVRALGRTLGAHEALLDGELVAFDEAGRPSFEALQQRMHVEGEGAIRRAARAQPVAYVVFDLLQLDGRSLLALPYERRRALLDELVLDGPAWRTPRAQHGGGAALLAATREQGLEGIVAKRLDSAYEPGRRSDAWRTLRNHDRVPLARRAVFDQAAGEVELDGRQLRFTNWDKVLFPATGFTKGDLIAYYVEIAPTLLGHLRDRPLTLRRWPDGVEGPSFFEKQCPSHRPEWVQTASIYSESEQRRIDYCLAQEPATLAWLANLAAIELHPSLALARDRTHPTAVVFDLDPGPPAGLDACAEVALVLAELFERLGLQSAVKTSGGKGLQVYVPLGEGVASYERTKPFARRVAELLEQRLPELVVARMTKRLRAGKVLVDWSQNVAHKTTVAVYSVRARERPTVSTPLGWEELRAAHAAGAAARLVFDPAAVLARVEQRGDLFAPLLGVRQELPAI